MERLGSRLYALGLLALPAWLREQAGDSMRETFAVRQREERARRGRAGLLALWLREALGLVRAAYRARRPDSWSRRTAPGSHHPHHRHPRPSAAMDNLTSDLRFAIRTFLRRPGTAGLAVLTLSLGIGASTAMFSVVQSVLLRPLPYPEPENLYSVYPGWPNLRGHPTLGDLADRGTWSWPEFFTVWEQQGSFERLGAYQGLEMTLSGDGRPERVPMAEATQDFFPILGARPELGRLFDADDGREGSPEVVLLTAGYWRDRFGGDPAVVGRTLHLNERPFTVIGVLPDDFEVTGVDAQMWRPKAGSPTDAGLGNHSGIRAIGRLPAGASVEGARGEIERILREGLPAEHGEHSASVFPRQSEETRRVRPVLIGLLVASGLLLAVACGNVAALLLGAGIDRERELAVRGAVGASRVRLVSQLLSESTLLALLGAAGGVAVAAATTRALVFLAPPGVPRLGDAALDPVVLGFAVALAMVCGIGFGSIPAWSLSSFELAESMGSSRTTGTRKARLQAAVVVGELALATVLVVAGVLLGRTVSALNAVDPGFRHTDLAVVSIATPFQRFREGSDEERRGALDAYTQQMLDELGSLPGVLGVATSSSPPLFGWRGNNGVQPEGWTDTENYPVAERRLVSANFFEVLGIHIVEGRGFERADEAVDAAPVVVVSRGLAELAWPGEAAVGKSLNHGWGPEASVVGVAADVRDEELSEVTALSYYVPQRQLQALTPPFIVRTSDAPLDLAPALRDRIWRVDADVPITRLEAMTDLMAADVAAQRYRARLMNVFASLAGLFALLGIYGVTARSVARRTQEMGLRVALGAARGRVHMLVTGQAVRLAVFGVFAGLLLAVAAGRVIESFLWGVSSTDPWTLAAVALGLPVFAALAALPPARRATRVDPLVALRAE